MHNIVVVCTDGIGISPFVRAALMEALKWQRTVAYKVYSAGTKIKEMNDFLAERGTLPTKNLVSLAVMGTERGFFPGQTSFLEKLSKTDNPTKLPEAITEMARISLGKFIYEESVFRTKAFEKFGFHIPAQDPAPFAPDASAVLVMGMKPTHVKHIEERYAEAQLIRHPFMDTFPGYALGAKGATIPYAFGKKLRDYLEMTDQLNKLAKKTAKRVVEEIGR